MVKDKRNVIPFMMAVLLHVLVFGSFFIAFDFSARAVPMTPLAIQGTIVSEDAVIQPPPVIESPEPDLQPIESPEPPPPEPDTSEQDRVEAERLQREEDARVEQERLNRIEREKEEKERQEAEAAEKRRAEAEAAEERRKEEEARKEREREEAERKRQEEIERQKAENERLRKEAEAAREAERAREIEAETRRLKAMQANAEAAYKFAINQKIQRNWVRPPTATAGIECIVNLKQLPGGEVVDVTIGSCNADSTVRRSIEAAVRKASPLPLPSDASVFQRNVTLVFKPAE